MRVRRTIPRLELDARGEMIIAADAHLEQGDGAVEKFCSFLEERGRRSACVVLLGDIFALWIAAPKLTGPHHRAVLASCEELRRAGVCVVFVEGNREFGAARWQGSSFDEVASRDAVVSWGGRLWHLAHGDLLDPEDRRHRVFRAFVRSRPVIRAFHALPVRLSRAISTRIERSLRGANLPRKSSLPRERLERYAGWLGTAGCECGVIGHLHVELSLAIDDPQGTRRSLFVLPDWRGDGRFLSVDESGDARFEQWGPGGEPLPVLLGVHSLGTDAVLSLDRPLDARPGDRVEVLSGHGWPARGGTVVSAGRERGESAAHSLTVRLAPGSPLQIGDRVRVVTRDAPTRDGPGSEKTAWE